MTCASLLIISATMLERACKQVKQEHNPTQWVAATGYTAHADSTAASCMMHTVFETVRNTL
jgi:hypothetical protein